MRNARFWGVLLWVFSLQVFVCTSGGKLGENIWLDVATGVIMFMAASFLLGYSLPGSGQVYFVSVILLIVVAIALMTIRSLGRTPYEWWDMMIVVAGPQAFVAAMGFILVSHRHRANNTQLNC
ncbi:MAG: hypothetical protein A2Y82_04130 [Candidatus Buchananbacteria bacterium RBG_13_36_9]|uniref:Uncharacterized protein n=1 Tax=Candidatus Buchananbacteria bacterium RBG_13_36_9 TaxID=1797530 RepID=A0A1G1XRG0_9BACT|nr:MAG: hypothetical protein A2Y82_04130 [Candidatus Buchananbacteria bacterium RBG_13_36_9]